MEPKKILDQAQFNNSLRAAFSIAFQAIAALWSDAEKKAIAAIRECVERAEQAVAQYATFVTVDDDAEGTNAEYFLGGEWPREDMEPTMVRGDEVVPQPRHQVTYTTVEGRRTVEADNWDGYTVMLPYSADGLTQVMDYHKETQYQFMQPLTAEEVQP